MIKAVAAVVILSMLGIAAYFIFQAGVDSERSEQAKNKEIARKKDRKKVETFNEYKAKLKATYEKRIKDIKTAKDPTGCADIPLVDMGFGL